MGRGGFVNTPLRDERGSCKRLPGQNNTGKGGEGKESTPFGPKKKEWEGGGRQIAVGGQTRGGRFQKKGLLHSTLNAQTEGKSQVGTLHRESTWKETVPGSEAEARKLEVCGLPNGEDGTRIRN